MSNFIRTLESVHRGELVGEADELLPELVAAVKQNGGTGAIALKVSVKNIGDGRVEVSGQVAISKPARKMPASLYYTNAANELQRNDPSQSVLDFRPTPEEETELRDAPSSNSSNSSK